MASTAAGQTMQAWQYNSITNGIEKNLYQSTITKPARMLSLNTQRNDEIVIEVMSMSLNPADYLLTEMGMVSRLMVPLPATPGMDFCGKVHATGSTVDSFRVGEMVFGKLMPQQHGSLGQFITVKKDMISPLPEGVDVDHAATIGTAGLTAYQAIAPYVKTGNKVFIQGGAGGVGVYAIQIAKALGCHVTATASTPKVALCKELGADDVVDYKTTDVMTYLKSKGQVFDLFVDNVGQPPELYRESTNFITTTGRFVQVGAKPSLESVGTLASRLLVPSFLGGGKRAFTLISCKTNVEELAKLGNWMKEGKVKAVVDRTYDYADAPQAIERLKSGQAAGKVVVHVMRKV